MFDPIDYALHYGPRCRDCADEDGTCPTKGTPCDPAITRAVAKRVMEAWAYGIENGYMVNPFSPASQNPAPQNHLPLPLNVAVGNAVSLADCPPGPFLFNSMLGFKTEYGAFAGKDVGDGKVEWEVTSNPDAYCMDSGEFFWGGTTTKDARADLMVHPVELIFAGPEHQTLSVPAIDQIHQDAGRYRFLRDNHVRLWSGLGGKCDSLDLDFEAKGDDLDAAIDAALADTLEGSTDDR